MIEEIIRRKIFFPETNSYKMQKLWVCRVKWGTQGTAIAYLFDEPVLGLKTKCIKWEPEQKGWIRFERHIGINIYDIQPHLIFVEMF